ncbi:MAG: hypothetical protein JW984_15195 [Deltaproteobacteria bacterium]|uniref:Uncharacterized protein n=1 Tax=Candidatus Zymogenus saltonus TaxID=2844893 RepID=A0A9D8KJS1_9DELT|nr:hypothetical protein [Candidatus Zymogenus saltonus]
MSDRLNEIKERWAKATPGPWSWEKEESPVSDKTVDYLKIKDSRGRSVLYSNDNDEEIQIKDEDAELIANAHADIEYLWDHIKVLEARIEELKYDKWKEIIGEAEGGTYPIIIKSPPENDK